VAGVFYNGGMVIAVEANTPDLLALVERTRQGGEVVLTVDGKPASRVTAAENAIAQVPPRTIDMEAWRRELEAHLYDGVTGYPRQTPSTNA